MEKLHAKRTIISRLDYLIGILSHRSNIQSHYDHHIYASCLNRDSLVIDLGAYQGEFASRVSGLFGCRCYAIEALPDSYNAITENELIKKFNYAISKNNGPVDLYVSNHATTTSIKKSISDTHGTKENITVEGINLEKFLEKNDIRDIDILKVDIEGAEIEMFNSISDNAILMAKQITVEFHTFIDSTMGGNVNAIKARLKRLGFFYMVFPVSWSNEHDCDVLFINKNKIKLTLSEKLYIFILKYVLLKLRCMLRENNKA
jgi:FkbM family methyltransferase